MLSKKDMKYSAEVRIQNLKLNILHLVPPSTYTS
jgi:hypothetical protein